MKWIILASLLYNVQTAKILGVFPMSAHSHFTAGYSLMKELSERGHDVTMLSPYPQKTPSRNYKDISLESVIDPFANRFKTQLQELESQYLYQSVPFFYSMGQYVVNDTLNHPEVQKLLNSKEKFDLVIMELFFNEALTYFAHHFKAPLILVSAVPSSGWSNHYFMNPSPSSYIPSIYVTMNSRMNLMERGYNLFVNLMEDIYRSAIVIPEQNKILHQHIPNAPHLEELMKAPSIILLNSHVSTNEPAPHLPNMIEVGGYHVRPTGKLPKDLQEFLDGAPESVVYFCMGSNVKTSEFSKEKQEAIIRSFARLKQKVLWKFEADSIPNQPKNVKLIKWAPQQDILAHPNVKLFISHGGFLGSVEAVYFGVPIIGIPLYGDQKMNVENSVNRGYAISIPFSELSEERLTSSLDEMLKNNKYSERVKELSSLMHDRLMEPIDEAVFWVEYVIRHPGADRFKSAAMELSLMQYYYIDLILIIIIISILSCFVIRQLCRYFSENTRRKINESSIRKKKK